MTQSPSFRPRSWRLCLLGLVPALLAGCCCTGTTPAGGCAGGRAGARNPLDKIDNHAVVPPEAIPAPLGTYVNAAAQTQAAKAEQDDFTIYLHEWTMGGTKLGPYGCYHLHKMISRLPGVPFPIIVQVDAMDETSNAARRNAIVNALEQAGVPNALQRMQLNFPEPGGLYGEEIEQIYRGMLRGSSGNQFGQGFGGFGGGFGANNFGGGGFGGGGAFGGSGFGGGFGGGGFGGGRGF